MKQYCRYCAYLCTGNGTWCEKKQKAIADSTAKTENHCTQFLFCELDAYDITKKYKAREKREKKEVVNQYLLFNGEE